MSDYRGLLEEEDWYQSQFFPIKTRKGQWDWGVPNMIQQPWDAWVRQIDAARGVGPGVTPDQQIEDALSVASLLSPAGLLRGGAAKGAVGAARSTGAATVAPVRTAPVRAATHGAYAEDAVKAAGDGMQRSVDPKFDWRKHVRVRKADNSDMTPLDHAKKREVEDGFKRLQGWKAENEIEDERLRDLMGGGRFDEDWIGGARPALPQTPYVMPGVDEYLSQMKQMLTTPADMEQHYRSLIDEIRIGERMQPGEVAWLEAYEKQMKPRRAPTHSGSKTVHEGSDFAALLLALAQSRRDE